MKVAVIGGGGREHALAWKLRRSGRVREVWCVPGNAGIAADARCEAVALAPPWNDLVAWCRRRAIDLVVVGPEGPLVDGIADALGRERIPCFGVGAEAARLEGSKAFAREVTASAGVSTHRWRMFEEADAAARFYRSRPEPWWIKADGLAAGKGAVLPQSLDDGAMMLRAWLGGGALGAAGRRVVLEEPLAGREASVIALVSGETVRCLAPSQDHKRVGDGDTGPNTGGMGAFAPTPALDAAQLAEVERTILAPTLAEMARRGHDVRGVLYAGLMLTAEGPRLLEYNVRLGDPEAQAILWLLENDLVELIEATIDGTLGRHELRQRAGAAVVVVGAAEGYPSTPHVGDPIEGLDRAADLLGDEGAVFHGGTRRTEDGRVVTAGGRVLGVTAGGATIDAAAARAYAAMDAITWRGRHLRRDIGREAAGG